MLYAYMHQASKSSGAHEPVTPAWRLPREVSTPSRAKAFVRERLLDEYGLQGGRLLGSWGAPTARRPG
jgi:hypothetical protein